MSHNVYQQPQNLLQNILHINLYDIVIRSISKFTSHYRKPYFIFNSHKYTYNNSHYNESYINERSIEVPIAQKFITKNKKILEVGNVLSHYCHASWTIVDKFEQSPNVLNIDILEYHPKSTFDQIISISTIEHIGLDDSVLNPKLGIAAIQKLKSLLNKNGEMFITIPVGYNHILDKNFLKKGVFERVYAMKRISPWNTWKQVDPCCVKNAKYGWPYNNANAIFIGYYLKP